MSEKVGSAELKLLDHIGSFNGDEEMWPSLRFKFEALVGGIRPDILDAMRLAEQCTESLDQALLTESAQSISRVLFFWLASIATESALGIIKSVSDGCGLEAWRLLCARYALHSVGQNLSKLRQIMQFRFGSLLEFEKRAQLFEQLVREYEAQTQEVISQSSQKAVLLEFAPPEVRQHLQLFAKSYRTFNDMKQAVVEFRNNAMAWGSAGADSEKPVPTEVMYVKGKGKGKWGKGKGKGKAKGKKGQCQQPAWPRTYTGDAMDVDESGFQQQYWGAPDSDIQCYVCWGWGHKAQHCANHRFYEGRGIQNIESNSEQFPVSPAKGSDHTEMIAPDDGWVLSVFTGECGSVTPCSEPLSVLEDRTETEV